MRMVSISSWVLFLISSAGYTSVGCFPRDVNYRESADNSPYVRPQLLYEVTVNTERAIHTVDKRFLSVVIDPHLIRKKWAGFNISSASLATLAQGLYPAYLRVGGTDEDFVLFQETETEVSEKPEHHHLNDDFCEMKDHTNFNITRADLDKIHELAVLSGWDVYFGLNVRLRDSGGQTWNSTNPLEIMRYTASRGYNFSWQLGNEPEDLKKFGPPVDATELGNSFIALRSILDRSPDLGRDIVGPDVTAMNRKSTKYYLLQFLSIAHGTVTAVTWHHYYLNGRECSVQDFYDPDILDTLLHQLKDVNDILLEKAPGKRGWLGETASAYGGGAPNISDRYVAGFMWLDKLGLAALLRHDVVMRESLFGGHYALIDQALKPNPDYWLSLLYKRLVGEKVLQVDGSLQEGRVVRVYAHCTSTRSGDYQAGAVTIMVLNLHNSIPAVLRMTGTLQGMGADQYLLTPDGGDLTSKLIRLNGNALQLMDDDTLPSFPPVRVSYDNMLVPPLTFAFYVIPMATAQACIQTQEITT